MNTFQKLAEMNVNDHVEKKGRFSYLSWPWAVKQLRLACPTASWEVIRFNGLPYLRSELGYFVEVAVTVDGVTLSQVHPVLDNNNRPIKSPDAFHINTSIQRCLVKAIALHGLGLYIYAGEDLPEEEKAPPKITEVKLTESSKSVPRDYFEKLDEDEQQFLREQYADVASAFKESAEHGFKRYMEIKEALDNDEILAWWFLFDSKQRSYLDKREEAERQKAA